MISKKILVIGDVCLDRYYYGTVSRVCPEAPVPILNYTHTEDKLGMAANVAVNLKALGCEPHLITLMSVESKIITALNEKEIAHSHSYDRHRIDTIKHRYYGNGHLLLRMDDESSREVSGLVEEILLKLIEENATDVTVIQDYGKGVITENVVKKAKESCKYLLIDPSSKASINKYNCKPFAILPNVLEAKMLTGKEDYFAANELHEKTGARNVILKKSERGIDHYRHGLLHGHYPALASNVKDVTGAGDTVIATVAACLTKGLALEEALKMAQKAAAMAVGIQGNAVISWKDLDN